MVDACLNYGMCNIFFEQHTVSSSSHTLYLHKLYVLFSCNLRHQKINSNILSVQKKIMCFSAHTLFKLLFTHEKAVRKRVTLKISSRIILGILVQ